jgi:hypothetical protein
MSSSKPKARLIVVSLVAAAIAILSTSMTARAVGSHEEPAAPISVVEGDASGVTPVARGVCSNNCAMTCTEHRECQLAGAGWCSLGCP